MKHSPPILTLACLLFWATACEQKTVLKHPPKAAHAPSSLSTAQQAQVKRTMQELNRMAWQSGLTALVGPRSHGHSWQEVDAYYHRVEQLPCSDDLKGFLKQRALYGLVTMYPFPKQAPREKQEFYAQELLAHYRPDPKLVIPFLEALKPSWKPVQTPNLKTRLDLLLGALVERNEQARAQLAQYNVAELPAADRPRYLAAKQRNEDQKVALGALQKKLVSYNLY